MKRHLSLVLFAALSLMPTFATASGNGPSSRQPMSNAKVTYQTRVVPALVDINLRIGNSMARGTTPQAAIASSVAGHLASRVVEHFQAQRAEKVQKIQDQQRNTSLTALTAARWSGYHASTLVPKSASIQPRTAPKGRSNDYHRRR